MLDEEPSQDTNPKTKPVRPVKARSTPPETSVEDPVPMPEGKIIPEPLAAVQVETDSVLHAHLVRQAGHGKEMSPAEQTKAILEEARIQQINEFGEIQAKWAAHVAEQQRIQQARDERATAASRAEALRAEIAELEATIETKTAEAERLEQLAKG